VEALRVAQVPTGGFQPSVLTAIIVPILTEEGQVTIGPDERAVVIQDRPSIVETAQAVAGVLERPRPSEGWIADTLRPGLFPTVIYGFGEETGLNDGPGPYFQSRSTPLLSLMGSVSATETHILLTDIPQTHEVVQKLFGVWINGDTLQDGPLVRYPWGAEAWAYVTHEPEPMRRAIDPLLSEDGYAANLGNRVLLVVDRAGVQERIREAMRLFAADSIL